MKRSIITLILILSPALASSFVLGGSYGPAVSPYLLHSTFGNGTSLIDYVPEIGATWTINSGTWAISAGKVSPSGGVNAKGYHLAYQDAGLANVTVIVDIFSSSSVFFEGLSLRAIDGLNYFFTGPCPGRGYAIATIISGVETIRSNWSSSYSAEPSTAYTLTAVTSGDSISLSLNKSGTIYTASYSTSAGNTATKFGLNSDGSPTYDNFIVQQ